MTASHPGPVGADVASMEPEQPAKSGMETTTATRKTGGVTAFMPMTVNLRESYRERKPPVDLVPRVVRACRVLRGGADGPRDRLPTNQVVRRGVLNDGLGRRIWPIGVAIHSPAVVEASPGTHRRAMVSVGIGVVRIDFLHRRIPQGTPSSGQARLAVPPPSPSVKSPGTGRPFLGIQAASWVCYEVETPTRC